MRGRLEMDGRKLCMYVRCVLAEKKKKNRGPTIHIWKKKREQIGRKKEPRSANIFFWLCTE